MPMPPPLPPSCVLLPPSLPPASSSPCARAYPTATLARRPPRRRLRLRVLQLASERASGLGRYTSPRMEEELALCDRHGWREDPSTFNPPSLSPSLPRHLTLSKACMMHAILFGPMSRRGSLVLHLAVSFDSFISDPGFAPIPLLRTTDGRPLARSCSRPLLAAFAWHYVAIILKSRGKHTQSVMLVH